MTMTNLNQYATDLSNWKTMREVVTEYPQFTYAQLRHLLWRRDEHDGLNHCCKIIGKKLYVCLPIFGLWMAGEMRATDS